MRDDSLNKSVNWFELDRLVDGQLNHAEYRELLRQIEKDPDGWRQCALAFLQHQALQQELQALSTDPTHPWAVPGDATAESPVTPAIRQRMLGSLKVMSSVAAALLIGVSLGVVLRPDMPDPYSSGTVAVETPVVSMAPLPAGDPAITNALASANDTGGVEENTVRYETPRGYGRTSLSPQFGDDRDEVISQDAHLGGGCCKRPRDRHNE